MIKELKENKLKLIKKMEGYSFEGNNYLTSSFVDERVNRTFDEIISERIEDNEFCTNIVDYTQIFHKIKNNLFKVNSEIIDIHSVDNEIMEYKQKFENLKSKISERYLSFTSSEQKFNKAKERYTTFCENITNCINSIISVPSNDKDTDFLLRDLLQSKIENCYEALQLETLKNDCETERTLFEQLKQNLKVFTCIVPTTICQICFENQVEYFIDTCGHTLCATCKDKCVSYENCHLCRTKKGLYKRIYL